LRLTAQAAGTHNGSWGKGGQHLSAGSYKYIADSRAPGNSADGQPGRILNGEILERVYGKVNPADKKGLFEFSRKKTFAANFWQGSIQCAVPLGFKRF
jgi:hypothetical protein